MKPNQIKKYLIHENGMKYYKIPIQIYDKLIYNLLSYF